MKQLPSPASAHSFSFNKKPYDGLDCNSTMTHFNPICKVHGFMNGIPSHVGDLDPIVDDNQGNAFYGTIEANRPSLFPGTDSVANRSMVVHEMRDDFGTQGELSQYNGSMGREIACCNVVVFYFLEDYEQEDAAVPDRGGRLLDDLDLECVEILTEEGYR